MNAMSTRAGAQGSQPNSLASGVPASEPGTLHALGIAGGITIGSGKGRVIRFGRNRPEVHICVGENDRRVSRRHGVLTSQGQEWWVHNTGQLPLRFPGSRLLFTEDEPIPLATGYTPLFVRGSGGREHLLELYVAGGDEQTDQARPGDSTHPPKKWPLSDSERLAVIVLGQRYLLHEQHPQPLSWGQAAEHLADLQPDAGWRARRVEHLIAAVRARLSEGGVSGLTREELGEPIGNTLNHNLIQKLMESTTLVPPDLQLLDDDSSED